MSGLIKRHKCSTSKNSGSPEKRVDTGLYVILPKGYCTETLSGPNVVKLSDRRISNKDQNKRQAVK